MNQAILDFAKKWLIDFAFKKIFGSVIGGVKGFLLKWIINKAWKEIVKPFLTNIIRWVEKKVRKSKYRKIGKKAIDAKDKDTRRKDIDNLLD